jgi:hypothetical protein
MEYKIWLVNFGWYSSETFSDLSKAIEYGISKCFEFRVDQGSKYICSWTFFGGVRYFEEV